MLHAKPDRTVAAGALGAYIKGKRLVSQAPLHEGSRDSVGASGRPEFFSAAEIDSMLGRLRGDGISPDHLPASGPKKENEPPLQVVEDFHDTIHIHFQLGRYEFGGHRLSVARQLSHDEMVEPPFLVAQSSEFALRLSHLKRDYPSKQPPWNRQNGALETQQYGFHYFSPLDPTGQVICFPAITEIILNRRNRVQ